MGGLVAFAGSAIDVKTAVDSGGGVSVRNIPCGMAPSSPETPASMVSPRSAQFSHQRDRPDWPVERVEERWCIGHTAFGPCTQRQMASSP